MRAALQSAYTTAVRRLARRSANACVIIAIIMCAVAAGYVAFIIADLPSAENSAPIWAMIELALSAWNIMVYIEKEKIRKARLRSVRERPARYG